MKMGLRFGYATGSQGRVSHLLGSKRWVSLAWVAASQRWRLTFFCFLFYFFSFIFSLFRLVLEFFFFFLVTEGRVERVYSISVII